MITVNPFAELASVTIPSIAMQLFVITTDITCNYWYFYGYFA